MMTAGMNIGCPRNISNSEPNEKDEASGISRLGRTEVMSRFLVAKPCWACLVALRRICKLVQEDLSITIYYHGRENNSSNNVYQ